MLQYQVSVQSNYETENQTMIVNETNTTVMELRPARNHSVTVVPFNCAGNGENASETFTTLEAGVAWLYLALS